VAAVGVLCLSFVGLLSRFHSPPQEAVLASSPDQNNGGDTSCAWGLPPRGTSGYFQVLGTSIRYFYYFAAAENRAMDEAPLVLWMNGGPGCSSLLGAMMENGPCKVVVLPPHVLFTSRKISYLNFDFVG
jgi:hypothetical protein